MEEHASLPPIAASASVGTQDPTASTEVCIHTQPGTFMQAAIDL